ncbi:Sodium transporter HKT1 [Forsythia ovata]|uniref:Sodium transporter HKT1 n=1 Tax=Forsythia ovata TaxID=205694 RepID=A0ABD1P2V4_9LAMI
MEVFSNSQLIVMTILMFIGGEVFTSMVGLHMKRSKIIKVWKSEGRVTSVDSYPASPRPSDFLDQIELSIVTIPDSGITRFESQNDVLSSYNTNNPFVKYNAIKFLGFLVLGYLLVMQILGIASVLIYLALISSAKDVLRKKGLKTLTFAIFTVVSTFASCGFVPTNENMIVFSKNSGLLWILIPQVLLGNTLFPSFLRFSIWVLGKKFKKDEANYLLKKTAEIGYLHLLPGMHSSFLVATVVGFVFLGAYGNVGFTTGYSCDRELKSDPNCVNKWYGFSGKWSDEGKLILIIVMFFGRLKKFNMNGGQPWKLL